MIRVCCYCGKILGIKRPFLTLQKTHGACDTCFNTEMEKIERGIYEKEKSWQTETGKTGQGNLFNQNRTKGEK